MLASLLGAQATALLLLVAPGRTSPGYWGEQHCSKQHFHLPFSLCEQQPSRTSQRCR